MEPIWGGYFWQMDTVSKFTNGQSEYSLAHQGQIRRAVIEVFITHAHG